RVIVREELPRRAVGAVVLADRAPGPLAHVGAPPFPMRLTVSRCVQPGLFCGHRFHGAGLDVGGAGWFHEREVEITAAPPACSKASRARADATSAWVSARRNLG